jgi:hypothetical protein
MKGFQLGLSVLSELVADCHEGIEVAFERMSAYQFYEVLQQLVEEFYLMSKEYVEDNQRILKT